MFVIAGCHVVRQFPTYLLCNEPHTIYRSLFDKCLSLISLFNGLIIQNNCKWRRISIVINEFVCWGQETREMKGFMWDWPFYGGIWCAFRLEFLLFAFFREF